MISPTQRHSEDDSFEPHWAGFYDDDEEDFLEDDDDEEIPGLVASDEKIESVVKELIHNSRRLDGDNISVEVDHSDVSLSGTVHSEEEKYAAGALVQLIQGNTLINEIGRRRL